MRTAFFVMREMSRRMIRTLINLKRLLKLSEGELLVLLMFGGATNRTLAFLGSYFTS